MDLISCYSVFIASFGQVNAKSEVPLDVKLKRYFGNSCEKNYFFSKVARFFSNDSALDYLK